MVSIPPVKEFRIPAEGIRPWRPTVAQAREVILKWCVIGPDFTDMFDCLPEAKMCVPNRREVETVARHTREAVEAGRLMDFGHLPNEVLKYGGERGGPLWNMGAFGQPFSDPWVIYHTWEGGAVHYLVNPIDDDSFEVCELEPGILGEVPTLMIADRGIFYKVAGGLPDKKYHCSVSPAAIRFLRDDAERARANQGGSPASSAAGNIGDPVMTALMILNTRHITRETIAADAKLNRARVKNRKLPIPPYTRFDTSPYVTAVLNRGKPRERGDSKGGHHASPMPHLRQGHPREYATGRTIFIADTLVNVPEEQRAAFKGNRSHYEVRP